MDVDSSEDFLPQFQPLKELEEQLRCPICKELRKSPVILNCSHAFCSLCIRNHLQALGSTNGDCPTCHVSATEAHIKPVRALEEILALWQAARPVLLELKELRARLDAGEELVNPKKRKAELPIASASNKKTKKQGHETRQKSQKEDADVEVIDVDIDEDESKSSIFDPNASVQCPLCNKAMKNAEVERHMTSKCPKRDGATSKIKSAQDGWPAAFARPGSQKITKVPSKLNPINGSVFKPDAIREKLEEYALYDNESKADRELSRDALAKRYNSFCHVYNANQDQSLDRRETMDALRRKVKSQEKQDQLATIRSKASALEPKKHLEKHKDQFQELAANIKKRQQASMQKQAVPESDEPTRSGPSKVSFAEQDEIITGDSVDALSLVHSPVDADTEEADAAIEDAVLDMLKEASERPSLSVPAHAVYNIEWPPKNSQRDVLQEWQEKQESAEDELDAEQEE